jgi:transcriptional regulator with XRE-family HTH domain
MECMEFRKKLEKLTTGPGKAAEIARRAGVPPQRISDWKDANQKRQPTITQAVSLARALGVSVDYLLDDTQDEPPPQLTPAEQQLIEAMRAARISPVAVAAMLMRADRKPELANLQPPIDTSALTEREQPAASEVHPKGNRQPAEAKRPPARK